MCNMQIACASLAFVALASGQTKCITKTIIEIAWSDALTEATCESIIYV